MQKDEYIRNLRKALSRLPESEREDIIADYEEHFSVGVSEGRDEADIAGALGDPRSLGREHAALFLVREAEIDPSARGLGRAVAATVGLGLFNLLVVLLPFLLLVLILILILVIGFSLACSGPLLTGYSVLSLLGIMPSGLSAPPLAGVFFGIGLTSAGLFLMVITGWLMRIFYRLGIRYLRWHISVITGKEVL